MRFVVNCKCQELPKLKSISEATEVKWIELTGDWRQEKLAFNHSDIIEWALTL
jgi:hypothetical protein